MRLLLIKERLSSAALLDGHLKKNGFVVDADTIKRAVALVYAVSYDLILLEVSSTASQVSRVIEILQAAANPAPIIVLAAHSTVADRIRWLAGGADD